MSLERYSWDHDAGSGSQQDDPWGDLRPTFDDGGDRVSTTSFKNPAEGLTPSFPGQVVQQTAVKPPAAARTFDANTTPVGAIDTLPNATPTGGPAQVPGGDYQSWFQKLVGHLPPRPDSLYGIETELNRYGIKVLRNAKGVGDKLQLPNGQVFDVIEAATANGGKSWTWNMDAGTMDGTARGLISSLGADGHTVKSDGLNALIVDGRRYLVNQPNRPTWNSSFEGQAPYTPTAITNEDLAGLGYQDVQTRLKTPVAGKTSALVQSILDNPESLNDLMVDTLKARSADEIADMARADEEGLLQFGYANNLADSNWLASERRAAQFARDRSLVASNRDIDITAAETRTKDRLAAAQMGTTFAAEERSREALATDVGLRAAAEKKDRHALNESLKQKAAELQISVDDMKLRYTQSVMEDITRRWGIEVQAGIDWAQLAMMDSQFQDELIFKMHQLDRQMQLGYDNLEFDYRKDAADRNVKAGGQ